MSTKNFFAISILTLIGFASCKKEAPLPTSEFTYTGGGCTAPCAVLFDNTSTNATSYLWNFGDGTTSTEINPTKTYNVGGTYSVSLKATGEGGAVSTTKMVLIQQSTQSQLPVANFTFSGGGCTAPCSVSFTNTSTNAVSYSWDFGDGTTSTSVNPNKTYTTGGTYSVILTATNAAGTNQLSKIVNIGAAPTKVRITNVIITNFPFVDGNGTSWDLFSGPDVFFNFVNQSNTVLFSGVSLKKMDVTSSMLPLSYTLTTPHEISDFVTAQYLDLWDYDSPDPDDFINYVGFQMSNYTSGANPYPTSVSLTQNGITFTMNLTWF